MEHHSPGTDEKTAAHNPESLPRLNIDNAAWRERLFTHVCAAAAAVLITAPFIYWIIAGIRPDVFGTVIGVGIITGILPFVTLVTVRTRYWMLCLVMLIALVALVMHQGFSPTFTGSYFLLLLIAGLLLGKTAMALVLGSGLAIFVTGGLAVDAGLLAIRPVGHDANKLYNWVNTAAVFGTICLMIVLIVRFATRVVNDLYTNTKRELLQARQLRKTAERVRAKRLTVERELRSSQKVQAVGQLSDGLAHLFNNALTVVRAALETVQANPSSQNRKRTQERIHDALVRTLQVTGDLMVFSRRDEPAIESVDLADELRNFIDNLAHAVPADIDVLSCSVPGLRVPIAPGQLRQILLNLVLNAADASRGSGKVQITAALFKEKGESEIYRAVLAIEDNGCGMSPDELLRAVDPFFTTKGEHGGLGLPVAHTIIDQAGGELRLESEEGKGTRVLVLLPLESSVSAGDADPANIWPTAHTLLRGVLGRHHEPAEPDEILPEEPMEHPAWQDQVTRQLARIATAIVAFSIIIVSPFVPHMVPLFIWCGLPTIALLAVSGWAPRLSGRPALFILTGALGGLGMAIVFLTSYDLATAMALIIVAVAWTALLGGRGDGLGAVLLVVVSFVLIGYFRSGPLPIPPVTNADMDVAANWFRLGSVFVLQGIAMAFSVVGVLSQARQGALAKVAALERVDEMRLREREEGARLLEIESHRTRSERSAAAGQAAGTVAHDLRNAVHALLMSSELLAADRLSEKGIASAISSLSDAVLYAEAIATQFDSIKVRDVKGDYPICDLSANVDAMVTLLRCVLPNGIELIADIESMAAIRINETELRRLLFNLVTNARDAIHTASDTGTITVSLSVQSDVVVLRVSDSGSGMDEDTKKRAFEAFFTTKKSGTGTGLGLHLVADIVRRSKGKIKVESEVGSGTSFIISWPREQLPAPILQKIDLPASAQYQGAVLLVEDELAVRAVMAQAIRKAGFRVVEASDGNQGKELALEGTDFIAACIDGVIPGAPSSEVITCFLRAHPGRPVLLCSGYMPDDLASRGLLRNGVTLLAKPFGPSRLRKELETAIRTANVLH